MLSSVRRICPFFGSGSPSLRAKLCLRASYSGITAPSPSSLDELVKIDELLQHSQDEIKEIWTQFHSDPKEQRGAETLTGEEYDKFRERATESKLFVLPLPKGQQPGSFLSLLVQCQLPYVLVTGLEDFRQFGPNAMPYVTLTVYPELRESKDLVLVRADNLNMKSISFQDTQAVASLVKQMYCDDAKYEFVRDFNHRPAAFSFDKLLKELGVQAAQA